MTSGPLALTCLLLAASAGPADNTTYINRLAFQIPVSIDPARQGDIAQVLLFKAERDGKDWAQVSAVPPTAKDGFTYVAEGDGLYLFKVQVKGRNGLVDPPNIYEAPVGQRVVVDTRPPEVRVVAADRQGDDVVVRWEVIETNPDLSTLKLEYRTSDGLGGLWTAANVTDPQSGTARFRPVGGTAVAVRMQMKDLALNEGRWAEAPVKGGAAPPSAPAVAPTGNATAGGVLPPLPPGPAPVADATSWSPNGPPGGGVPMRLVSNPGGKSEPSEAVRDVAAPPGGGSKPNVLAQTSGMSSYDSPPTAPRQPRGGIAPARIIRTKTLTLDFEVTKFGPSGLGSVDLYVTRNDGQTWMPAGQREIRQPVAADPKGLPPSLKQSLEVGLSEDGKYGFYLVVKSGAGLSKPAPKDGDAPQVTVELDTEAPKASLYSPEPDPRRRDALILRWEARDKNIGDRPISLFWSEDGSDWKPIAENLGNSGEHPWAVAAGVPHKVFLRLDVRDQAGNVATAVPREPITVDLNEPEVKSISIGGAK